MAHVGQELTLSAVGGLSRRLRALQTDFYLLTSGYVSKKPGASDVLPAFTAQGGGIAFEYPVVL